MANQTSSKTSNADITLRSLKKAPCGPFCFLGFNKSQAKKRGGLTRPHFFPNPFDPFHRPDESHPAMSFLPPSSVTGVSVRRHRTDISIFPSECNWPNAVAVPRHRTEIHKNIAIYQQHTKNTTAFIVVYPFDGKPNAYATLGKSLHAKPANRVSAATAAKETKKPRTSRGFSYYACVPVIGTTTRSTGHSSPGSPEDV